MFFFGTNVPLEPYLTSVLPEFNICSLKLYQSGVEHTVVCRVTNTVLHCYAQWTSSVQTSCEYILVIGSYNFI